jgi:hypothetical protein
MSGIAQIIPSAASDLSLPKLFAHPEMAEGTLFLFDPRHEYGAFSGVPLDGGKVPNVASRQALPILSGSGAASISDLDAPVSFMADTNGMLVERSAKGGIHILPSQLNMTTNNNYWIARIPAAIRTYVWNLLPGDGLNGIYFSFWFVTTRGNVAGLTTMSYAHMIAGAGTTPYVYHTAASPVSAGGLLGSYSGASGNARILLGGASAFGGTKPGSPLPTSSLFGNGLMDQWGISTNRNKPGGRLYVRAKIEDLRLNKRANNGTGGTIAQEFAAAQAADVAAWTKEFGLGGAFNGDTWTDPATFA